MWKIFSVVFLFSLFPSLAHANMIRADLGEDNVKEIILGAHPHEAPIVRVLREDETEIGTFLAYDEEMTGGINVVVCNVDGTGTHEIITAPYSEHEPIVRLFSHYGVEQTNGELLAYEQEFHGGINLACGDLDGDGIDELVTLPQPGGGPHVRIWKWTGVWSLWKNYFADHYSDRRGLFGMVKNGELFVSPASQNNVQKSIVIDLSEQKLTAYEFGDPVHSFFISSARAPWITPKGDHTITHKKPFVHYRWNYANSAHDYDLGLVPFNLQFYPHIYIHYAPWHNNFGTPMSHGCVNVNLKNITWLYHWSEVGVSVSVVE